MVEPGKEYAQHLIRHIGFQLQLQVLVAQFGPPHPEEGAIELMVPEPVGQYMGHVRFQAALERVGGIGNRGPEVYVSLLRES